MASKSTLYPGADYGLDPESPEFFADYSTGISGSVQPASFGYTTDPRTTNQIQAVSQKLSTGAKTIEVTGVTPAELESIPKQQFDEINRLRKLAGTELTFHGPIVEASGYGESGWSESTRMQAERQMFNAVERAHQLNPDGNVVITFHSTASLPEMEQKVKTKNGEEVTELIIFDERSGSATRMKPKENFFMGGEKDAYKELEKQNKDQWYRQLQGVSFHAHNGKSSMDQVLRGLENPEGTLKMYEEYINNPQEMKKKYKEFSPSMEKTFSEITHGDLYLRDAYQQLQESFNQAYQAAKSENRKDDLKKLDAYREELAGKLKDIEKPSNVEKLNEEIIRGVDVLRTIAPPKVFKPMNEFAIDKSSDTYSNLALKSFNEFGSNSPIISIENPPAGGGLSRAEDLRKLVEKSREKFIEKAKDSGLSEDEAKQQAEKIIGATWDVGHINMLRKYGYGDKELLKQTEKIAPFVKHIHLSDNFGLEHTELPMGMGNVPIKGHIEKLQKQYGDKMKQIKQIVETGGSWFRDFKITPIAETMRAFGSPIYGMKMAPYWNQASGLSGAGGYFAGYGLNPDIHHSIYGAGFSGLPIELGGQVGGRNRLSGAPME